MLKIAYSPIYKYALPKGHRFPMEKYDLLPQQLLYEGTVIEENFFHPQKLSEDDILGTHTSAYWNKLKSLNLTRREEREIGFPIRDNLIERGRYIARGTYEGAKYALKYGIAMNIAGGTHHAYAAKGEGFCIFNDMAIASNMLLRENLVQKILFIDLDVHQGNGNAKIFENRPEVFTFSMHGERNYPLRKEKSDLDIGLPDGTADKEYLYTLELTLDDLFSKLKPDLVFYQAGVDVLDTDKLGRLSLSLDGCKKRDELVLTACQQEKVPVMICMGGGYSIRLSEIIEAHANTYRLAQRLYF